MRGSPSRSPLTVSLTRRRPTAGRSCCPRNPPCRTRISSRCSGNRTPWSIFRNRTTHSSKNLLRSLPTSADSVGGHRLWCRQHRCHQLLAGCVANQNQLASDPYENIYVVVRGTLRLPHVTTSPRSESLRAALTRVRPGPTPPGTKRVRLLPMTDAYRMRIGLYSQSKWEYENGAFTSRQIEGEPVPWSSLAPCTCEAGSRCPSCLHLGGHPPPKEVLLHAGDVLYIPAWVYHEVSHDRPDDDRPDDDASCIAINMWYEAQYGQHGFCHDTDLRSQLAQLCTPSTNT